MSDTKVCEMVHVRGGDDGATWLWLSDNRFVVRAYNQCGHDCVDIDLLDLLHWLRKISPANVINPEEVINAVAILRNFGQRVDSE